jgi:hypothetical protein
MRGPFDRIVAIVHFVAEGVERALRHELAAHVLADDNVTLRCIPLGWAVHERLGQCLVVRKPDQQHRIAAVFNGFVDVSK